MKKKNNYQVSYKIPLNLTIEKKDSFLWFSGPLGFSKLNINKIDRKGSLAFCINIEKKNITIIGSDKSIHRTVSSLIKNKMDGVSQGYILYLRIVGIGYRCFLQNGILTFRLGFSHEVHYEGPSSIRTFLIQPTLLCLYGLDKNQITQIAAQIRQIRPPSPYKGKGVRLVHEKVQLKQGKQK